MILTDRIKFIADELGISIRQIERDIGATDGIISKSIKRKSDVGGYLLNKIVHRYAINPKWLLTGEGEMKMPYPDNMKDEVIPVSMDGKVIMNVPFVNQYAYAGYLGEYANDTYISRLPKMPWMVDKEYKGIYMSFEVKGDSMDDNSRDSYIEGDILLCREISKDLWKSSKLHIRKWDFVIAHKTEGIIVKKIIDHNVEKGIVKLHSLNDQYPDYDVKLKDVLKIFNVVRVERKK